MRGHFRNFRMQPLCFIFCHLKPSNVTELIMRFSKLKTVCRLVSYSTTTDIRRPHRRSRLVLPPLPPPQVFPSTASNPNCSYNNDDFSTLCNLLSDSNLKHGQTLETALDRTGIKPEPSLLQSVFDHFNTSPRLVHALFLWAGKNPEFQSSATLFNSVINALGKLKEFDSAWCLILARISLVSSDTFAILIRRYTRAGRPQSAIRTLEYAVSLSLMCNDSVVLMEILLDSLCKEGHVRVAKEYFDRKKQMGPSWAPSVRMYNILLNGWFRSRKLKHAERLWLEMKQENVRPSVVTYGTLVEGLCRMRRVDMAVELLDDMKKEGIEGNAIVYNPIIDALAEEGRFKEVSGKMEYLLQSESGPTISTYNSLVKGYCKARDLVGASKVLKMMISRGVNPTPTTYNYFFRHFSKFGMIEEGMNLYTKMIESGYIPDRLTFHLLLKMLCEQERLDLAVQISNEMKAKGCEMDLDTSTMLIHLFCIAHRFQEAFKEFEDMLRKGIVPQYLTYQRLNDELRKRGMVEMARNLRDLMSSVPHSTNLPNTYSVEADALRRARRSSILQKAEAMSEILKTCNDPRELVKHRSSSQNPLSSANRLIEDIKRRCNMT
ncbi:pentatricopeptide repeat-containing protein At5g11310, mitochondrial [Mercurialis annua]|uniref:pentatricopeptide repeat-containing protein At5g11310, mitochondrial n=1 Tax=Mercurialis annua TaxID=3986 RepID=UPI00215EF0BD|nr:pentatricopeptide repeat-containing protein At5g11310, mitochondrial [Mercurialis annua]XP_050232484.1 pentatricopeptide repeat-containing protein At5g11310, mitochondrial [Mercurialis annua]